MSGFMLLAEAERAIVACQAELARLRAERDEARLLLVRAGNAITTLEVGAFLAKVPP
jgi:hypothetical protein